MSEKGLLVEVRVEEEEVYLPKIAEMSLNFASIDGLSMTGAKAFRLADDLEERIQKAANHRFGRNIVKVTCYSVRPGSLIIDLALTAIWMGATAKGTVYFLSNYAKTREGVLLLAQDLRNMRSLYKIVTSYLSKSKSKKKLSSSHEEKRRLQQTMGDE